MDKEVRNRIQRATQDARALLEREYAEQLEGTFDIRLDGTIAAEPGAHLDAEQRVLRAKLVAAVEHRRAGGMSRSETVVAYRREAAFTTLNRFVALKMLEARGLVQECLSRGEQSSGFKEFTGLAPGLVQLSDHGYRLYIESLFDEIGREVRVLFDRRDPASLLWPRRQALIDLLAVLNAPALADIWKEDETIGWVYQYFNNDEERRKMRAESQAPRNSHELAVRNQFFTPRYVVEFLTDNTLGRIWYEMQNGKTRLVDQCNYLVRRPTEIFLTEGQQAPDKAKSSDENLSQEELLKKPVYVLFRSKKDPRDLKILDPACGSGHFLLYAFDLLVNIYEEGWEDDFSSRSEATGRRLQDDYATLEDLRYALPRLILQYNLHGTDIDPRATQIAALALWMRAQRAYNDFGVGRGTRPPISKTQIVVAEPMPGERELRQEFIASLDSQLGQLVERVFEKMDLAGEAGSLLKIEDEIQTAIRDIYSETGSLFRKSDEEKWQEAEHDLLDSLSKYAARAQNDFAYRRRLFAEDTARGFAFIDLCRQHFDIVLMNPPFGSEPESIAPHLRVEFPVGYVDLACAFIDHAIELVRPVGKIGVIATRTPLFLSSFEKWRRASLLGTQGWLQCGVDLGVGILDAMVETVAFTISATSTTPAIAFIDCRVEPANQGHLANAIKEQKYTVVAHAVLCSMPSAPICYWLVDGLSKFNELPSLGSIAEFFVTSRTGDDARFVRAFWEVLPSDIMPSRSRRWRRLSKGGAYCAFYNPVQLVVDWRGDGALLGESLYLRRPREGYCWGPKSRVHGFVGTPGLIWSSRSQKGLSFRVLPADCATTNKSLLLTTRDSGLDLGLLAYLNARSTWEAASCMTTFGAYERGTIEKIPVDQQALADLSHVGHRAFESALRIARLRETDPHYSLILASVSIDPRERVHQLKSNASLELEQLRAALVEIDRRCGVEWPVDEPDERVAELAVLIEQVSVEDIAFDLVGLALGRWWIGSLEDQDPHLGGPFDALPVWQKAQWRDGSIAERSSFDAPPLLVDDIGHKEDTASILRDVSREIWKEHGEGALQLLEASLGVTEIGEWIRKRAFEAHVERYTASRRKAPIYWQLATPSASYSVWLYYHRFTKDTFYRVLDYVTDKLQHEERKFTSLPQTTGPNPTASQRKERAAQEAFVEELRAFREEVARITPLWKPDLNDGVLINFAPLWRLVPHHRDWQKECKDCWDTLVAGDYDWSHLAMHLWPERVVPKCAGDRSLAIAHGLEDIFWIEGADGKWQPRKVDKATVDQLIAERTSPAVKEALHNLLNAPAPTGGRRSSSNQTVRRASRQLSRVAPATTRTNGTASESASRTDPAIFDAVKQVIASAADGASTPEILAATGLTTSQWNAAINTLLAQGVVTKTGERRGTRYYSAETGGQS